MANIRQLKKLLGILKDGKWRRRVTVNGIRVRTVDTAEYLKLIESEPVTAVKDKNGLLHHWIWSYRITENGRNVLKSRNYPTPEEFSLAIVHAYFLKHSL